MLPFSLLTATGRVLEERQELFSDLPSKNRSVS